MIKLATAPIPTGFFVTEKSSYVLALSHGAHVFQLLSFLQPQRLRQLKPRVCHHLRSRPHTMCVFFSYTQLLPFPSSFASQFGVFGYASRWVPALGQFGTEKKHRLQIPCIFVLLHQHATPLRVSACNYNHGLGVSLVIFCNAFFSAIPQFSDLLPSMAS